jgi:hypothetical protein
MIKSILERIPRVDATDKEYQDFYSLFKTEKQRIGFLVELPIWDRIKDRIKNKPKYFEKGLEYIFNKCSQDKKIYPAQKILFSKFFRNKKDFESQYHLFKLYESIVNQPTLWEGMFLIYSNLENLDVFENLDTIYSKD